MKDEIYSGHVDALSEILDSHGVDVPLDKLELIAKDFKHHLDLCAEMNNTPFEARFQGEHRCEKCSSKDMVIKDLEKQISIYNNSVKQRRKASSVWIEDGEVRYEL